MSQILDYSPSLPPKTFVLCFDGTGNKFCGTEADSNVLKIFRMLDRNQGRHFHYYQPGIGTYVTTASLSNTGLLSRIKGSYMKAKDSAIGSSFAEHVMGGYRFLMRYYSPGDDIYFIGFSRGAYTARFLAEMLDYVGLLTAGNEELVRFAWKTFSKWQQRSGDSLEHAREKRNMFKFMKAFRETFSRPIKQIRFLGLFDTVNSVPTFESAWMQRSKYPYTARSSAKMIRHAVGIDERRAKFRQDLISECRRCATTCTPFTKKHGLWKNRKNLKAKVLSVQPIEKSDDHLPRSGGHNEHSNDCSQKGSTGNAMPPLPLCINPYETEDRYRPVTNMKVWREQGARLSTYSAQDLESDAASARSVQSQISLHTNSRLHFGEDGIQDIQEVWFPGGHADIGGGWELTAGEKWPLSHAPLVWMVQEAQKAGLQFDERKLRQFRCSMPYTQECSTTIIEKPSVIITDENGEHPKSEDQNDSIFRTSIGEEFHDALHLSSIQGQLHDCLSFNGGLSTMSVLIWKAMEYLPFRRMDLQADGSWKPIRWPLPCGEVRDIPKDALIHVSAIRRMQADQNYRPGNLIVGGGGRGVRRAPEYMGMGEWVVASDKGDTVRETYVRKDFRKIPLQHHIAAIINGHMQLSQPFPVRSSLDKKAMIKDFSYTAPLKPDGSDYPCKGYHKDPFRAIAEYLLGQNYSIKVVGSATHGGGSCQISISHDNGETFKVIKSIVGGCPLKNEYSFTVPRDVPPGNAILAWTWFNKVGNREMYMNCAHIIIIKAKKRRQNNHSVFTSLPRIFIANIRGEKQCKTKEGADIKFPELGLDVEYGSDGHKTLKPGFSCNDDVSASDRGLPTSSANTTYAPTSTKPLRQGASTVETADHGNYKENQNYDSCSAMYIPPSATSHTFRSSSSPPFPTAANSPNIAPTDGAYGTPTGGGRCITGTIRCDSETSFSLCVDGRGFVFIGSVRSGIKCRGGGLVEGLEVG
ncbi:hypothetical protein LOZ65_005741 [Ophidiomyces ophidiicola]|nr:hypothetical protein LOZ65_005741 [Ophidiomyces ophidiicola]